MRKILLLLSLLIVGGHLFPQCSVTTSATSTTITCGQSVSLSAFGQSSGTVVLSENFNSGGFGPGWGSTPGAVNFNNPCSAGGVDGTPHAWMDNNTAVPRILMSSPYDLTSATAGVTICFDLLFAEQGNSAPCEGPDEPDEGVFLQYSTNGGSTWTDIHYFDPNGGNDPTFTTWHNWCFVIPAAAITANTTFQWLQTADSGADYDHWGIDNVQIYQNDVNGQLVWLHDGYNYGVGNPGGVNPTPVSPLITTTYTAQLTTGTGTVCTDAITITVVDPIYEVTASATPASLCPGDCANITATAQEVISPHTTPTYENNEFEVVTGGSASVNINVQGLNTTSITNGTITEVVINGFDFSGTQFCSSFGGCNCNGTTISFGDQCDLNTSGFTVTLTAPGGCDIILVPSGVATTAYNNTTFVPVGGSAFGGSFPNGGTWAPNQPMSGLNGCNPNGVWTLSFDGADFGFGFGTLEGWSISFDDPAIYGPVTYTWSPTTNMTNSTTLTPTVCPPSSTTYSLTVANPNPGCATHVETVPITVGSCTICTPPVFTVTPPAAVCAPATIDLASTVSGTGTGIVTYHATNADATGDVNPLGSSVVSSSGTYFIRVEDAADPLCFTVQNVTVTINPIATLTPTISGSVSVCPNATAITYSVTNNAGNTYNWTVPAGATIASGQGTNSITINFGASGGNVSVTETANCGSGSNSLAVTVSATPVTSAISGPSPVCPNATAITYSVVNSSGSTYNWSVPAGATIASGQGTNSITVNFGASGGTISVTETSPCGTGTPVSTVVNTSSTPVTSAISGPGTVCANATGQVYSVVNTAGSTYVWSVPAGATITSGQNTNSITVNFGATAGTISVTETSTCGSGTPVNTVVSITTGPALPTIVGPTSACANATGLTYSVTLNGTNTYAWTVPAGATIVSGQGTNSIVVNLGATAGNVSVIETNTCGASPQATTAVTLSTTPVTSAITGPSPVCSGSASQVYSVVNTASSTYAWTVPSGATIVSGQGTNSINVDFGTNGGTVSVIETASCGVGTAVQLSVTMNTAPATPSIVGSTILCANATATTYTVTSNTGSTYAWTATGGATIVSGSATNSVTVDFATTNGTLQVTESNSCGNAVASLTITVANPVINVTASTSSVCPGYTSTLTASGADTYTWTPSGSLNTSNGASVVATPTATTIYTVNGTLAGCPVSSSVTITLLPPLTLTVTSTSSVVCTATTTTITATGATSYTWSPAASLNVSTGSSVIATPSVQTTYTVLGTTSTCTGSSTITVSVTPVPTIQLTPNDVTICQGESVNILASGADTYVWANNATNFVSNDPPVNSDVTVNPPSTHLYFVTGSTNGCTDFDTLTVTVLPKIFPNAGLNDTICIGESIGLIGFGGTTHQWSPGTTLSSVNTAFTMATPFVSTNYIYTSSYNGSCPQSDTVRVVVNPLPIVFAGQDTTIDVEDVALIHGFTDASSFFWNSSATLSCTNCLTPIATPTVTTTYILEGTNQFGCYNSDTITVFVSQEFALYVPIAFSPNGDFTNENWKPEGFGIKKIQIYVYNRWGQKLYEAKDLDSFWDGKYQGNIVQEDVYVFKITAEAYSGDKITKVGHVTVVR